MDLSESDVRKQVLDYLRKTGVFIFEDRQVSGKPGRGTRRKSNGVADLLGIYKTFPLAIELKRKGGTLSKEQYDFLVRFKQEGGIGIVSTGVEELQVELASEYHRLTRTRTTAGVS